jgi:hypothetical protein
MSDNLQKAYIFGAGAVGRAILPSVQKQYQVIAYLDNDENKWSKKLEGLAVRSPMSLINADYDAIIVASQAGLNSITAQLLDFGVERKDIRTDFVDFSVKSRIIFMNHLGGLFRKQDIQGSVAECGVFQRRQSQDIADQTRTSIKNLEAAPVVRLPPILKVNRVDLVGGADIIQLAHQPFPWRLPFSSFCGAD